MRQGSPVNAKAIRYIDCPTCGSPRFEPCTTLKTAKQYKGDWFVHEARKAPFMTEFWRGVQYQANLSLKHKQLF